MDVLSNPLVVSPCCTPVLHFCIDLIVFWESMTELFAAEVCSSCDQQWLLRGSQYCINEKCPPVTHFIVRLNIQSYCEASFDCSGFKC